MPILVCPICGATRKIKPSQAGHVFTCGANDCRYERSARKFETRRGEELGEPLSIVLRRLYLDKKKNPREICSQLKLGIRTFPKLMTRYNIRARSRSEAVRLQWEGNDERRAQTAEAIRLRITRYYANGGISPAKSPAARAKNSAAKLKNNWMRGRTGSKHHGWLGGKKWWRGADWDAIKRKKREADGCCTRCGRTPAESLAEFGAPLQVHHIVPYRLSRDNSLDNLRTLCNRCHGLADAEFVYLL